MYAGKICTVLQPSSLLAILSKQGYGQELGVGGAKERNNGQEECEAASAHLFKSRACELRKVCHRSET